jgi:hypothetical protein
VRIGVLFVAFVLAVNSRPGAAQESRSAALQVSATVVASCTVTASRDQIAYRCTRGARGPVRVNGQNRPAPTDQGAPASQMRANGSLVTIDF